MRPEKQKLIGLTLAGGKGQSHQERKIARENGQQKSIHTTHRHPPLFKTEMKGKQPAPDGAELSALALGGKRPFKFILMGTPEVGVCSWGGCVGGWMDGVGGGGGVCGFDVFVGGGYRLLVGLSGGWADC